jgi:MOSC domain-containing protein YiiM
MDQGQDSVLSLQVNVTCAQVIMPLGCKIEPGEAMIRVTSVNIGKEETLKGPDRDFVTGINKKPVVATIMVDELGLRNDAVCDTRYHGGPDQAIYLYRLEDYAWWSNELGRDVAAGMFGDNLTLQGLDGPALMVGDRLRFTDLELEVTAPRIPCSTLATKMGDPKFARAFVQAERPGIYVRVTQTGSITVGDAAELVPYARDSISTVTFFRDIQRKLSGQEIRRYLELPIDIRSRTDLEKRLGKAR